MTMDPQTPEEWQTAATMAHLLLTIESARMYGLIEGGPKVDLQRCEQILELARRRKVYPQKLTDQEIGAFIAQINMEAEAN